MTTTDQDKWSTIHGDAVATLSRYVQFDTTNPPGNEMAAAEWLAGEIKRRGITDDVTVFEPAPGRGLVMGRIEGQEPLKPLVLNHHMDVVPADASQWSHAPFGGEVADGYVWGRGTLDTKNLGVIHMLALEQLIRQGAKFRRPIIFLAVPDEETGGAQGMEWLVNNHLDGLDPEWVWDEGSAGYTGMMGEQPLFGIAVAEKQIQHLRLVAEGEPGHGAMPHQNNASAALTDALHRILKPRPVRLTEVTATMFREIGRAAKFPMSFALKHLRNPLLLRLVEKKLGSDRQLNAMMRDTISLTMLQSGYKINVIPERAEAGIDCRLLTDTDAGEFHRWLSETINDPRVRVEEIRTSAPTMVSPIDGPFFDAARHALGRHLPDAIAFPLQTPGGTDSRYFRARGIPGYGFGPFVIDIQEIHRVHGIDERISVDNLELGIRIACDVIEELCGEAV
jgi:acetylornithine deacetylase/succinyl-diaminopimelate desuccinylase-like protein